MGFVIISAPIPAEAFLVHRWRGVRPPLTPPLISLYLLAPLSPTYVLGNTGSDSEVAPGLKVAKLCCRGKET